MNSRSFQTLNISLFGGLCLCPVRHDITSANVSRKAKRPANPESILYNVTSAVTTRNKLRLKEKDNVRLCSRTVPHTIESRLACLGKREPVYLALALALALALTLVDLNLYSL